jgi:molybdopterin/thiamine biosynthesis adenylyltransferase
MSDPARRDFSRHARQVVLPQVGVDGQAALYDARVLVIGLGGLGSPAAMYLAAAGVGSLTLADRDRVERSNLQRQLLYGEADVGRRKTEAAAARLRALDQTLEVQVHEGRLTPEDLAHMVRAADVVLDCTDNFPTRFAINAACVAARRPLVVGAAIRDQGQVFLVDPRVADAPCYACLYPEAGESAERCEDAGVYGPLVGIIGSLQAQMTLQLLLGQSPAPGVLHSFDAGAWRWHQARAQRDPACAICGDRA